MAAWECTRVYLCVPPLPWGLLSTFGCPEESSGGPSCARLSVSACTHFCWNHTRDLSSWVGGRVGMLSFSRYGWFLKVFLTNYTLTTSESVSITPHPCEPLILEGFFIWVRVGVQGYQIVVLIHISLICFLPLMCVLFL